MLEPVPAVARADARPPTAPRGTPTPTPTPTTVLIVDDQAPFRSAARSLVGLLKGWRVEGEAETGEDAVRLAAERHPDVVLMDINLPGRNGIESTRDLLAVHPSAVVVLLSTYAESDLPAGAGGCGAVGYLAKEQLSPRVLRELTAGPLAAARGQRPEATTAGGTEPASGGAPDPASGGGSGAARAGRDTGMLPRTDVPAPGAETS